MLSWPYSRISSSSSDDSNLCGLIANVDTSALAMLLRFLYYNDAETTYRWVLLCVSFQLIVCASVNWGSSGERLY